MTAIIFIIAFIAIQFASYRHDVTQFKRELKRRNLYNKKRNYEEIIYSSTKNK